MSAPQSPAWAPDRWWAHVLRTPRRRALWDVGAPAAVTLMAALVRLVNLGWPPSLVFDESYYVKDALSMSRLGYEGTWPDGANDAVNSGLTDGFSAVPEFAVHPPLGKWMIALGFLTRGRADPVSWRIVMAVCGVLIVLLVCIVGRLLTASTLLGSLAGLFMAIDGQAIVLSRLGILDNALTLLCLVGFTCVVIDRRRRLRGTDAQSLWRPWLLAAGTAFGLACAVKWSGLWFLAAFGLYAFASTAGRRPTRRSLTRAVTAGLTMAVPAAAVYLASWTGWLLTYARHPTGGGSALAALWKLHRDIYAFHLALAPGPGEAGRAWQWLLYTQPIDMYTRTVTVSSGTGTCGAGTCREIVFMSPNPLVWWAAIAALLALIVMFVRTRKPAHGLILLGVAAGYLPWLVFPGRIVYQFYTIVFEPYLMLSLAVGIGLVMGARTDPVRSRAIGVSAAAAFVVASLYVSTFFLPIWVAASITDGFLDAHMWLPTWKWH